MATRPAPQEIVPTSLAIFQFKERRTEMDGEEFANLFSNSAGTQKPKPGPPAPKGPPPPKQPSPQGD
eukprot:2348577-Amphidinium_carterae.1